MRKEDKMLAKQGIIVKISDKALDVLADRGYDPQFGARPMKRVLQRDVINELSKEVLSGKFATGDTIYIDTDKQGLTFSKEPFDGVVVEEKAPTEEEKAEEAAAAKAKEEAEEAKRKEHRKKQLEELQKATQDVMDAAAEVKKNQKKGKETNKKE